MEEDVELLRGMNLHVLLYNTAFSPRIPNFRSERTSCLYYSTLEVVYKKCVFGM